MYKLVLLRHGESTWNKENRFTGWTDVGLTEKGIEEAVEAGRILKQQGYVFDVAFTSVLQKAIKTLEIVLKEMGLENISVEKSWRFNERFYGALQGLNKSETSEKYGEEQVLLWRRSYGEKPPPITEEDERYPGRDPLYKDLIKEEIPLTESLEDVENREIPYWEKEIAPAIKSNKKVIICAHGNSLRALVKYLDNVSPDEISDLNIPTGIPLVYELDDSLKPIKHYYLGDQEKVKQATQVVINQGKVSKK